MKHYKSIPILLNSYKVRKPFIDICLFYIDKFLSDNSIYLTIDTDDVDFENHKNLNILTYDTIHRTSDLLHECHSRYYRNYYTIKYLESLGHDYVMSYMDDGWIESINYNLMDKSINYLNQSDFDRIDICGPLLDYKLQKINEDISIVVPTNCTWYFHNQCAIWKIDTLIKIYENVGPISDTGLERFGSQISQNMGCKFLTFNYHAINNEGCFQRNRGFNERGISLLNEYCEKNNKNFETILNGFNTFI